MGSIPASYLPPKELWPQRIYTEPEHQTYPQKLNSTEELVDRHVEAGRGERVAILFEDQKITYRQLQTSINKLGAALKSLGVAEEDRVLLRSPSIPPALVANFAVLKIGGIVIPTSPLFSRAELVHVATNTEAVALIVAAPLLEEVEKARGELSTVKRIIVIGGDAAELKAKGYVPYGELMAKGAERLEPVRRDRMAVSVLLFTSGTTGLPKGTVHFMEEALIVPDGFGKHGWRVTPDDVIGGPAPLSLAAGYSTQAVIPFRFGAAVSLLARFTPEGMFEAIQKHRITILSVLPTAYRKMLQIPEAEKRYDLSSLKTCTGGGESLTAQTYHEWKSKFGLEIYEGLGTTEMMFVFVSSAVTRKVKPGAIGPAVPGYELKVV
ncbi:MAG: AMP-binding protein, partial [Candidatus Methylomirabilia bacterium]